MKNQEHRFPYEWTLKDAVFTKDKGKVFSCFSCGGGSTMGYKLAGFDVIGCNEIDPKMMEVYKLNHNPKYSFLESITTFAKRKDLPKELYELDILDGSPPCSSFSMAGNREKDWGKEKVFKEGQKKQVLDTLFFDFIDLAKELQPKVVIAENVEGLLLGNAKQYVIEIYKQFDIANYYVQHFLLDASKMGVPQQRKRVFFIALRKDLSKKFLIQKDLFTIIPKFKLDFSEDEIAFGKIKSDFGVQKKSERQKLILKHFIPGDRDICDINLRIHKKTSGFNAKIVYDDEVMGTITSDSEKYRASDCLHCTLDEYIKAGSYPSDYIGVSNYLIGMSVPPVMTAQIATEIYNQWLSKL